MQIFFSLFLFSSMYLSISSANPKQIGKFSQFYKFKSALSPPPIVEGAEKKWGVHFGSSSLVPITPSESSVLGDGFFPIL